jgi:hypothetical protein
MQKRKVVLFLVLIILLLTVYLFRYPIFYRFQISRLRSLSCAKDGCFSRIWAHRVNTIERRKYLSEFLGYELDVIYTGPKGFAVLHPPDKVVGDTLRLETYLDKADFSKHRFWLDTRFIDSSNMKEALVALNKLVRRYPAGFNNCILEVYYLPVARLLAASGYNVSFNVSQRWLDNLPGNRSLQDSVKEILRDVKYVSQDAAYLRVVKQIFPDKKILTWHLAINDFFNRKELKALLSDPQVEIVLVNIKTP